jgi:hypothetical protein
MAKQSAGSSAGRRKVTGTWMVDALATPLRVAGRNSQSATAVRAAWSSAGWPELVSTVMSCGRPLLPITSLSTLVPSPPMHATSGG